jgi:hypothetical protein
VTVKNIRLNPFGRSEAVRVRILLKRPPFRGKYVGILPPGLRKKDRKRTSRPKSTTVLISHWYHLLQTHHDIIGHYLLTCKGRERAE